MPSAAANASNLLASSLRMDDDTRARMTRRRRGEPRQVLSRPAIGLTVNSQGRGCDDEKDAYTPGAWKKMVTRRLHSRSEPMIPPTLTATKAALGMLSLSPCATTFVPGEGHVASPTSPTARAAHFAALAAQPRKLKL